MGGGDTNGLIISTFARKSTVNNTNYEKDGTVAQQAHCSAINGTWQ